MSKDRKIFNTGIKGFIQENMPYSWYVILKRNRKITKFIQLMYDKLPENNKGDYYKQGIYRIARLFRDFEHKKPLHIESAIKARETSEGYEYWNDIWNQILTLEDQWR